MAAPRPSRRGKEMVDGRLRLPFTLECVGPLSLQNLFLCLWVRGRGRQCCCVSRPV